MATGWVKSLHCKSNAMDDVYQPIPSTFPKKPLLPLSCGASSSHALKDVVFLLPKQHSSSSSSSRRRRRPKPLLSPQPPPAPEPKPEQRRRRPKKPRPKPSKRTAPPPPAPAPPPPPHAFPTMTALPDGHSSRRVVEIIFSSSWSLLNSPFPGEIEMLFRVHNPPRTAARFEEYRAAVRSRSGGDARCAADGNEMMRFHCSPSSGGAVYDAGVTCCEVAGAGGKLVSAIRTFAGSGGAHESGGGGGRSGRRAMLVCRVIAGRVRSGSEDEPEGDSVCAGPGELLVFDPRAVLPCFLIIYKI